MSTDRSLLLKLYAVSAAVAVVILGPMLRSLATGGTCCTGMRCRRRGRMSPIPRSVSAGFLRGRSHRTGCSRCSRRWSTAGSWWSRCWVRLMLAGVGWPARRLAVPAAGHAGACFAAVVAVESLCGRTSLQGHWSLLMSYAALGWVAVAVMDRPCGFRGWVVLAGLFAGRGSRRRGRCLPVSWR